MKKQNVSDEKIERLALEDADALPMDEEAWKDAKFMDYEDFLPEPKEKVCLRLDHEVLNWFRKGGKGYQTRINAVLRAFVAQQEGRE